MLTQSHWIVLSTKTYTIWINYFKINIQKLIVVYPGSKWTSFSESVLPVFFFFWPHPNRVRMRSKKVLYSHNVLWKSGVHFAYKKSTRFPLAAYGNDRSEPTKTGLFWPPRETENTPKLFAVVATANKFFASAAVQAGLRAVREGIFVKATNPFGYWVAKLPAN